MKDKVPYGCDVCCLTNQSETRELLLYSDQEEMKKLFQRISDWCFLPGFIWENENIKVREFEDTKGADRQTRSRPTKWNDRQTKNTQHYTEN